MKKKYELAKKQGLNWQALLIEETQSEIKALIQRMYLNRNSYYEINREVVKIVKATIEELESEQLKATAEPSLYRFATRVYNYMKEQFKALNWVMLSALVAVASNKASVEQVRVVRELSQETLGSYNMGLPLDIYANEYMDYVKDRIDRLAKIEAKEDYTSRVNLRNIAEIQVRQERHEQELADLKASGVNLVWIVPHANCSERCEDWQGKLYSLDDTYGEIDGIKYQPLKNATDRYETTKSGKIYKNGCLSGFNCRHTLEPYKKGNKPIEIPSKVVEKQRAVNNKQRYLERGVREWKEKALLYKYIDKRLYKFARAKAKQWNDRYIEYSKKNNVAYYPSRTEII